MTSQPDTPQPTDAALSGSATETTAPPLTPGRILYGIYAWLAFAVCALFALLAVLLLPGIARRRRWVTRIGRVPFLLAAVRVTITGMQRLPDQACVVVANHASYVDGVVLQAFLPPRFSYVIKGEMQNVPIVGFLLRRIGAHFVDRYTVGRSARDARTILRAADNGDSLAFFPEGTFLPKPGLGPFRGGAFAAAVRTQAPIVPVVIRGSRQLLPPGLPLPAYGALQIDILEPIDTSAVTDTKLLAETARQRILAVLDEPDLLAE
ncbi:MAG: lysophospholipid acyltransferase family protein [Woeseia sp.]